MTSSQSITKLFIIPIRFSNAGSGYNSYIDFVVEAEKAGYTHVYVGEHLTDTHEDIQSSMIFAAAALARTSTINICLSVLPLPHYNIPLLTKQLEDLYLLGSGRIHLGFGPGALQSDLKYLGIERINRYQVFSEKLQEFRDYLLKSPVLSSLYPQDTFSTLLSEYPDKVSSVLESGSYVISSNFTHPTH